MKDESRMMKVMLSLHPCDLHPSFSEVAATFGVAAVAINLYGGARAFARRATVVAAICHRAAAGWVLTDSFLLLVRHLDLPPMNLNCRLFGSAP
jgi:hypothetical protein